MTPCVLPEKETTVTPLCIEATPERRQEKSFLLRLDTVTYRELLRKAATSHRGRINMEPQRWR